MIECNKCRQCNRKGKPSVTKQSAYCDTHKIDRKILRHDYFAKLKQKIFDLTHPTDEEGFIIPERSKKKGGFRW